MTENQYSNYEGSFKNDLLGYTLNQIYYNDLTFCNKYPNKDSIQNIREK